MQEPYQATGPIFEPGPGWGGKLKKWTKKYIFGWDCTLCRSFRFVLVFGVVFLLFAWPKLNTPKWTETARQNIVTETVRTKDGQTHLARRLLDKFLKQNAEMQLTNGQKIFIETVLREKVPTELGVGKEVSLDSGEIKIAIEKAKLLTASQLQRWEQYAKGVEF